MYKALHSLCYVQASWLTYVSSILHSNPRLRLSAYLFFVVVDHVQSKIAYLLIKVNLAFLHVLFSYQYLSFLHPYTSIFNAFCAYQCTVFLALNRQATLPTNLAHRRLSPMLFLTCLSGRILTPYHLYIDCPGSILLSLQPLHTSFSRVYIPLNLLQPLYNQNIATQLWSL